MPVLRSRGGDSFHEKQSRREGTKSRLLPTLLRCPLFKAVSQHSKVRGKQPRWGEHKALLSSQAHTLSAKSRPCHILYTDGEEAVGKIQVAPTL